MFQNKKNCLLLLLMLPCFLQVFANAGLSSPILASIITGGVNLAFTVAAASVLDRSAAGSTGRFSRVTAAASGACMWCGGPACGAVLLCFR